jgi:NADP-dependent 3-hydroxy acid dehydrogenase YdfG
MDLNNKVAVITGVSKGIGYELVKQLLEKGAKVYGLGRNNNDIKNASYKFIPCDVRRMDQVDAALAEVCSESANRVDLLVNNAGLGYFGFLEDTTPEQWHEMYETNVNSIFYFCRKIIPMMKQQDYGHIINIASTAGLEGYPQAAAYCGSKWAVKGISESMYKELRDFRIKVTCVYPGSVKTDFFRNNPNIKPHDYMLMPRDLVEMMVQTIEMPGNFHTVNLEVRPLQPKGPATSVNKSKA